MCGIVGVLDNDHGSSSGRLEPLIEAMAGTMRHRGPDGAGQWIDPAEGIGLGHRRLAIIDLSATGAQPMHSADQRFVITYNGEIYNYPELKAELHRRGHRFRGQSDTEVMLAGFVEWGVAHALTRFCGMFALALWDRMERRLTLARDRLGEKPLYYGWLGPTLAFASELKALRRHPSWEGDIDRDVLALYCRTNYVPGPHSIYRGIRKLEPGCTVSFESDRLRAGSLSTPAPFWSLSEVADSAAKARFKGSEEEATDRLETILSEVVKGQMLSDVPLGALLSGGIDSSTVVALMQKQSSRPVKTFTIRFDEAAYNEAEYARAVAVHLGTEHTEFHVGAREALDVIPRLPEWYDEPFGDSSQIPTSLVARVARQQVTVCLTGDGGDEVFCGYNRHVQLRSLWRRLAAAPPGVRRAAAWLARHVPVGSYEWFLRRRRWGVLGDQVQKLPSILEAPDLESAYLALTGFWPDPTALVLGSAMPRTLLSDRSAWPALSEPMDRLLYVESMTSLPDDMLVKVDRAAMAVSLETRVPLLDHRVVEFAWSLPLEFKLRGNRGKQILRKLLHRYVPPHLVERPKWGFGPPLDVWLRGPLRDWAEALLDPRQLRHDGFLEATMVRQCWQEHLSGRRKWQGRLWGVLMFQAWLEEQRASLAQPAPTH